MAPITRIDTGARLGLGVVALLCAAYPLVDGPADHPLAMFVIAPLVAAVWARASATILVSVVTFAVAAVQGWLFGLRGVPLVVRLVIIAAGSLAAVTAAATRERKQRELDEAKVQIALAARLQRGLVPEPHPSAGVTVATRYQPGERGLMIGGDFIEVIALPDGCTAFVIGDVSGHGPDAASFGIAVRAGWKSVAYSEPLRCAQWLDEVEDAFFYDARFRGFVTAITGRLDPRDGRLDMVSAGHPWPIRIGPEPTTVPLRIGPPLGIRTGVARTVTEERLSSTDRLLLYTDGLVENPRSPGGRAGDDGLLRTLGGLGGAADLDRLLDLLGPDGFPDDVALLLLGRDLG